MKQSWKQEVDDAGQFVASMQYFGQHPELVEAVELGWTVQLSFNEEGAVTGHILNPPSSELVH